MYRRLLVGTDGSDTAAIAVRAAAALANALRADLVAVFAREPDQPGPTDPTLDRAVSISGEHGVEAKPEVREGEPAEAIMESAEEHGVDLIVLGNRGMGTARRFVLGGVPDQVSHYSPCDLLIVRTTEGKGERPHVYRRVLIATDGSPTADEAARRGVEMARALGAAVTLLYVGDELEGGIALEKTTGRLGPDGISGLVLGGDPADVICEVAEREGFDLVVVGNKGMTGARRYLVGSVPNNVSHYAPADVLIAKTVGRSIEDLEPGTGAIVVAGGKKVAAYRDEEGRVHAVSARCTHQGCTVGWNASEKTWDCPCHGSRYDSGGKVIEGPAERDLAPYDMDS